MPKATRLRNQRLVMVDTLIRLQSRAMLLQVGDSPFLVDALLARLEKLNNNFEDLNQQLMDEVEKLDADDINVQNKIEDLVIEIMAYLMQAKQEAMTNTTTTRHEDHNVSVEVNAGPTMPPIELPKFSDV